MGFSKWRQVVFVEVTDEEISDFNKITAPKSTIDVKKKHCFIRIAVKLSIYKLSFEKNVIPTKDRFFSKNPNYTNPIIHLRLGENRGIKTSNLSVFTSPSANNYSIWR